MDRLSQLLPRVLQKRGLRNQADAAHAVYLADRWLREQIPLFQDSLHAVYVREGVLRIEADHPIALQECAQRTTDLLAFLRECGHASVQEIHALRSRGES